MITISGKTFNHRDYLKEIGARWHPASKTWTLQHADPKSIEYLKNQPGLNVTGSIDIPAPVNPPSPSDNSIRRIIDDSTITPPNDVQGETYIYGDDLTYFGAFDNGAPMTFFGFSSLPKLVEFVNTEAVKHRSSVDAHRRNCWSITQHWLEKSLVMSMAHATELAMDGWAEGVAEAEEFIASLDREHARQRRRQYNVAGGGVNVGRMLAGNPVHMTRRRKQEGRKNIRVFVNVGMLSRIKPAFARFRAIAVAAGIELLERSGHRCELIAYSGNQYATGAHGFAVEVACVLKQPHEKLDLNSIIFALGHPAFLRRMIFALRTIDGRHTSLWLGMGISCPAFTNNHVFAPNEFYLEHAQITMQEQLARMAKANPTLTQEQVLRFLFNAVTPDNYPIKLREIDE